MRLQVQTSLREIKICLLLEKFSKFLTFLKIVKNLENFYKSIQILVSLSEVWTCNLMITSLVSYPLDHRGKLENLAVYVYFIIKIQKIPLLANEMYKLQTHFGFTNLCSEGASFCIISSQRVKNGTRTPCTFENHQFWKLQLIFLRYTFCRSLCLQFLWIKFM